MFAPREGKRISLTLDYTNSYTHSLIPILDPAYETSSNSLYVMHANTAGAWVDLALCQTWCHGAKLSFGGSLMLNNGSLPTNFYQPRAQFMVPLRPRVTWTTEWRYYGYRESLYPVENFNYHLFSTGLRLRL
jgi:hypothetical protein